MRNDEDRWNERREEHQGPRRSFFDTRQAGPPLPNYNQVPFEKWDWQRNDPIFYEQYHLLPDAKDPVKRDQVKWTRYNFASNFQGSGMPKVNVRSGSFLKIMRFEIFLFAFGIFGGLMAPIVWRRRNEHRAKHGGYGGQVGQSPHEYAEA